MLVCTGGHQGGRDAGGADAPDGEDPGGLGRDQVHPEEGGEGHPRHHTQHGHRQVRPIAAVGCMSSPVLATWSLWYQPSGAQRHSCAARRRPPPQTTIFRSTAYRRCAQSCCGLQVLAESAGACVCRCGGAHSSQGHRRGRQEREDSHHHGALVAATCLQWPRAARSSQCRWTDDGATRADLIPSREEIASFAWAL